MRAKWIGINVKAANPVVCGRRFCAHCGRWRHVVDFRPRQENHQPSSVCSGCHNASRRARYARWTPEQRERKREYGRFWAEKERRLAGTPERGFKHRRSVVDRSERIFLPREPLVAEVEHYMRQHNGGRLPKNGDPRLPLPWRALARMAGINERAMTRLRTAESARVRIDLADKIATAIGVPLSLIYPADTPIQRR